MINIPDKLNNLIPYEPDPGEYKIRLDANESMLSPPKELDDLIDLALHQVEIKRYPDPYASRVCQFFAEYYEIEPELVTAGNGSDELISVIINAFLNKNDRITILTPDFSMYEFYASIAELDIVRIDKNEDLSVDIEKTIDEVKKSGAKMLILSNPCNPTSLGIKRFEMVKLMNNLPDVLVVLDEAYMDFWDQSLLQVAYEHDNLIILRTCSKMMGSAAIRLGFAVANKTLTGYIKKTKSPYNVNSLTQAAGAAVLAHPVLLESAVQRITISRNELYLSLLGIATGKEMTVYETCTNFVLVKLNNAEKVFEGLKSEEILVRKIGENYLRITAGTKAENLELTNVIYKYI